MSGYIARYESDARLPHAKTIVDIANFFSVSTDYLLKEDENLVAVEDRELLELTSKADKLSDQDKDFIKNTIQNTLKASSYMLRLKSRCKLFRGNFTVLWHNCFFKHPNDTAIYETPIKENDGSIDSI